MLLEAVAAFLAMLMSALLTGVVYRVALSHGVLDFPNERSSHQVPTPRGGGLAIVATCTVACVALRLLGNITANLFWALSGGGLAVAVVGFLDDRRHISAGVRLAVHVGAALWALWWLGGMPALMLGERIVKLDWIGDLLGVLGIVWMLNLFNFMDGIDGIAASEAVFVTWGGALLLLVTAGSVGGVAAIALAFGAACSGFLVWNWPPAKIFMGDAGSGYLGFVIGVLVLATSRENPVTLWVWLILSGVFVVDATLTLVRRLFAGERVYEAHRSHAYQQLAHRWHSHERVTSAVLAVNLLWLLPCASFAIMHPSLALMIGLVALLPVVIAAWAGGAGRSEEAA